MKLSLVLKNLDPLLTREGENRKTLPMKRKQVNEVMQAQAIKNTLPDGMYLTSPRWGYSERLVNIEGGIVRLASDGKYGFTQNDFFSVNDVLEKR
jgi:hypothetical protein